MNANLFAYLIGALAGTAGFWLAYRVFLYNRPQHGLARAFLLAAMVLPLFLPLLQTLLPVRAAGLSLSYTLPEQLVGQARPTVAAPISWSTFFGYLYIAIFAVLLLRRVVAAVTLRRQLRDAPYRERRGIRTYTGTGYGPGSMGTIIFFPGAEPESDILAHETGHIRLGHRYDLAFANLICCMGWMNPFLWMLRRELRLVHEFEADAFAAANGAAAESYARLLLRQSFDLQAPAFSHSFFHKPVKQRITMLFNKETSSSRRAARVVAAGCSAAIIATSLLFVQCKQETAKPAHESSVLKYADHMASFNGDLNDYLVKSLQYPEDARKAGNEGRSIVQFVVTKDGTVEDPTVVRSSGFSSLDNESMRVVRNMPAWKPATDKGRPVSVYFTLPITFKLDD
jgi:TonB family protein